MGVKVSSDGKKVQVPFDAQFAQSLMQWGVPHKHIGDTTAFPLTDTTWRIARSFYELPSPMSLRYKYPGFTPMSHQIHGANHLAYRQRAQLWSAIGTGKTSMSLWAMDYCMTYHKCSRVLVLAPKSTLINVWGTHLSRMMPYRKYEVLKGSSVDKAAQVRSTKAQIVVANHDSTRYVADALQQWAPDIIIVDEQTVYGNITSGRTKGLRQLIKSGTRVWFLTGKPMPDTPMNVHGPAHITCPSRVPKQMSAFRPMVMWQTAGGFWKPRTDAPEIIAGLLGDAVLRINREDCFDLPPTTFTATKCEPSKGLVHIIRKLKAEAEVALSEATVVATTEAVYRIKILQSACGAVKTQNAKGEDVAVTIDCDSKFEALADILDGTDRPVLLFTPYRAPLEALHKWLTRHKIPTVVVHGGTSMSSRTEAFRAIAQNEAKVLLAVPDAMAHGINELTVSDTIVWWGAPATNRVYDQANGRIVRMGQNQKTYIIHLASCKLERVSYERLMQKRALEGSLLELIRTVV